MSAETPTPKTIWIITEETSETSTTTNETSTVSDARSSGDTGGRLGVETTEEIIVSKKENEIVMTRRKAVEVTKLKQEMKGFLQAMREILDEADEPNSKIQLQEVGDLRLSFSKFGGAVRSHFLRAKAERSCILNRKISADNKAASQKM